MSLHDVIAQQLDYTEIEIAIDSIDDWYTIQAAGLDVDHYHKTQEGNIHLVANHFDMVMLNEHNIAYTVVQEDLQEFYAKRLAQSSDNKMACGLSNFSLGSMGGYLTYEEVMQHLSSMHEQFPQFVSPPDSIGQSFDGIAVPMIKFSDNPQVDESEIEPAVYYEALTHAREPNSMMVLIFYMWWMLENHEEVPEIAYLLNNREIYFVPIVNPDGYLYNQAIAPNGGGLWRKTRRSSQLDESCWGVDLNRNYSHLWGFDIGSSSDPCSPTFRGEEPFSEIESQNVRDFVESIQPTVAFSNHSYGNKFMNPLSPVDSLVDYESYSEFSSAFIPYEYLGYGLVSEMLNYYSSGTTRDYLHSQGIYAWTPEIGTSFWPEQEDICPTAQKFLKALRYTTWIGGAYVNILDQELLDQDFLEPESVHTIAARLKNRGVGGPAKAVELRLSSDNPHVTIVEESFFLDTLPARSSTDAPLYFSFSLEESVEPGDEIQFTLRASQEQIITDSLRFSYFVEAPNSQVLFADDAESGMINWMSNGQQPWDTTFVDAVSGNHCFADSRYGNYQQGENNSIEMLEFVDLSGTSRPILEFQAKWALEYLSDRVMLELVHENGSISNLGLYTDQVISELSSNDFTGHRHWQQLRYDLSSFIGTSIKLRFTLLADNLVQSDGFFFDDIKIYDADWLNPLESEQVEQGKDFQVFPNPASDYLMIQGITLENQLTRFEIHDLSGKLLQKGHLRPEQARIHLEQAHEAMVVITIYLADGILRKKTLILH